MSFTWSHLKTFFKVRFWKHRSIRRESVSDDDVKRLFILRKGDVPCVILHTYTPVR
jgi:hypothetical protein